MFIPVPIRSCRVAIAGAIRFEEDRIKQDTEALKANSFQRLHDGAVHNGLTPSASDLQQMRDMVDRDVAHAIESHPGHNMLKVLHNYEAMLAYAVSQKSCSEDDDTVLGDDDFHLLGQYLPKDEPEQAVAEEAAA